MGSSEVGEAGKRYALFTRELGLVYARATGVRHMKSKLRFVLTDFAYVKADLVQGKNFWRITSASKTSKLENITKHRATFEIFGNIARLLSRLLVAAEPNPKLFEDVIAGLSVLEGSKAEDLPNVEAVMVLRILHNLGYIGSGALEPITTSPFEPELVYKASAARTLILKEINKALRESQL